MRQHRVRRTRSERRADETVVDAGKTGRSVTGRLDAGDDLLDEIDARLERQSALPQFRQTPGQ